MSLHLIATDDDWSGRATGNPYEFVCGWDSLVSDATRDHESAVMCHHEDCAGVISWRARVRDRVAAYADHPSWHVSC